MSRAIRLLLAVAVAVQSSPVTFRGFNDACAQEAKPDPSPEFDFKSAIGQEAVVTRTSGFVIRGRIVSLDGMSVTVKSGRNITVNARDVQSLQLRDVTLAYDPETKKIGVKQTNPAAVPKPANPAQGAVPKPANAAVSKSKNDSKANFGIPVFLELKSNGKWTDRVGPIGDSDELGDQKEGELILIVQNGKVCFCSKREVKAPEPENEGAIAVSPFQEGAKVLSGQDLKESATGRDMSLITKDHRVIPIRFFQVQNDIIFYNVPDDPEKTETRRELPLTEFEMLALVGQQRAMDFVGAFGGNPSVLLENPRRIGITYDSQRRTFWANSLVSETESIEELPSSALLGKSVTDDWGSRIVGVRSQIGYFERFRQFKQEYEYAGSAAIKEIHASGAVTYQFASLVIDPGLRKVSLRKVAHTTCPGLVSVIKLIDGAVFRYSPSLRAFLHDSSSPMPVTIRIVNEIDDDRRVEYNRFVGLIMPPKNIEKVKWKELTPENRLLLEKDLLRGVEAKDLPDAWERRTKTTPEEAMTTFLSPEKPGDPRSNETSFFHSLSVIRQIAPDFQPWTWDDLNPEQKRLFHSLALVKAREIAARNEKTKEMVTMAGVLLGVAVGYKMVVEPAMDRITGSGNGPVGGKRTSEAASKPNNKPGATSRRISGTLSDKNGKPVPRNTELRIHDDIGEPLGALFGPKKIVTGPNGEFTCDVPVHQPSGADPTITIWLYAKEGKVQKKLWQGKLDSDKKISLQE